MSILIVDDNELVAKVLEGNLKKWDYQTIVAKNGKQALEHLGLHSEIRLVIMDIMMPEMDGLELLSRIKQTPEWNNLPVIVCSSLADAKTVKKAIAMGCRYYLIKPVNAKALQKEVAKALKQEIPVLDDQDRVMAEFGLDRDSYEEILQTFYTLLCQKIALLEQQIDQNNPTLPPEDLSEFSQSASIVGAKRAVVVINRLAEKSRDSEPEELIAEYRLLLRELKGLQKTLESHPAFPDSGHDSKKGDMDKGK